MSSIYFTEPPTKGKVLLKTTVGDIDIELWSKEAPLACRNFVQLCMEGYYNDTIFHRIVYDFIAQGGDPTGTGEGGESIYGKPFKDEFHQRLKFNRRGLVGMANGGKDDNASQFFFTLGRADELNNKNTLFGKVTGDTVYNMVKLNEVQIDLTERPIEPPFIFKTEILKNPFDDIVPRDSRTKTAKSEAEKLKSQSKATKNFSLLSFGEEAEEEEEELIEASKHHKIKSSHDILSDPNLVNQPALSSDDLQNEAKRPRIDIEDEDELPVEENVEIKDNTKIDMLKRESEMIANEIKEAKKRLLQEELERKRREENLPEAVKEIRQERARYMSKKMLQPQKGWEREEAAMDLLAQFKSRLLSRRVNKESATEEEEEETEETPVISEANNNDTSTAEGEGDDDEEMENKIDWLTNQVTFNEERIVLAKDALNKDVDYYDIYDPRNPLNERRRQEKPVAKKPNN